MPTKRYKCLNLADCDKALTGEIFELSDGDELECPGCGRKLELVPEQTAGRGKIVVVAVAAVIVLAAVGFFIWFSSAPDGGGIVEAPPGGGTIDAPPPESASPCWAAGGQGCGPCKLLPARDVDVARLIQYMKQGMMYTAMNQPEAALAEFQQGLKIDPNFIGLQQNTGAAYLILKKYDDADKALTAETRLIDCLKPLPDDVLQKFAYMLEVAEKDPAQRAASQATTMRSRLKSVEATTQYNLTCLYSLKKEKEPALEALEKALAAGFDNKEMLNSDSDLSFIRSSPEFAKLVNKL